MIVVIIVIIGGIWIASSVGIETEYIPEIEIDGKNMRKTMISLYFINKETSEIEKETRLIDSKELLKNPYDKVLELLASGPQSENLIRVIPNGAKIISTELNNDVLTICMSSEFLKAFEDENSKDMIISAISKTVSEFKEINSVNIKIQENNG
jgi:spore germination protein GerM